ncbi:MAG: GNAT family N-acetyltransferase [Anaerolineae bacterium]|nr:GNAT family N-acetyltransferase [Anaerolineae bacterium]
MKVLIRRATVDDAQGVVDVINSVIEEGGLTSLYPTLSVEEEEAFIGGLGPRSIMYVAEVEGIVLGVQTIEPFAPYTRAMDHIGVLGTYVYRNFRRRGAGRRLFAETLVFARAQGYEKLIIFVRASNRGAQAFYREMGFTPKMVMERQVKIEGQYDDEVWMDMAVPAAPAVAPRAPQAATVRAGAGVDPIVGAVTVRRAKRRDVATLAAIMGGTMRWRKPPTQDQVLEMLFDKGYWLAMSRKGGGLSGWRAENLVMCIDDFYVYPAQYYAQVGGPLLETIEAEAKALSCEVAISFLAQQIAPEAVAFFQAHGYERMSLGDLYPVWREVAEEFLDGSNQMMVKRLREGRIMRPL